MTERRFTTALFVLRALQAGLTLRDLDEMESGEVTDIIIEQGNDNCEYQQIATQEDFDKF